MLPREKQQIAQGFNRAASQYDEHAVLQRTVCERLLSRLDYLKLSPEMVVDLGSGTGEAARAIARRFRKSRFFSPHHYLLADMERLPLADSTMDMVFSSLTLQWSRDPDRVFSEIQRVLKPDGLFLFSTLGPDTLKELRASWAEADTRPHVNTFLDMHDLGDGLVRAGLEDVVMDVEIMTMKYTDCFQLLRDLKVVGANSLLTGRASGLMGKGVMNRMMDAYESYRQAGLLPATYEVVYGHARKPLHPRTQTEATISVDSLRRSLKK
ncbi:MAG: malonyl-ACP O-methyltransferase [Gammaproteobacteria bacterium]